MQGATRPLMQQALAGCDTGALSWQRGYKQKKSQRKKHEATRSSQRSCLFVLFDFSHRHRAIVRWLWMWCNEGRGVSGVCGQVCRPEPCGCFIADLYSLPLTTQPPTLPLHRNRQTQIHTPMHLHAYTHTHIWKYKRTHTHTHTHTHTQSVHT